MAEFKQGNRHGRWVLSPDMTKEEKAAWLKFTMNLPKPKQETDNA